MRVGRLTCLVLLSCLTCLVVLAGDEVSQSAGTDRGTDGTADTLDRDEVRAGSRQVDVSTVWQMMRCVLHVCCMCQSGDDVRCGSRMR